MSDWNEENRQDLTGQPEETAPENEQTPQEEQIPQGEQTPQETPGVQEAPGTPDGQDAPPPPGNGGEQNASGGNQPPAAPEPPKQAPDSIWAYSWDGSAQTQKKKGKGTKAFFIIAAICLVLCLAVCIPTILFSIRYVRNQGEVSEPAGETSKPAQTTSTPEVSEQSGEAAEPSYDVSETVKPSGKTYVESSELTELYERCSKSCVTIYAATGGSRGSAYIGSGFVLTEDGYIATNQHLVEGCSVFEVTFYDGTEYDATLVGADAVRDLAVLKIEAKGLTVLEIGDSSALRPGQEVVTIGTPYSAELAGTITRGIISGVNREIEMHDDYGRATKTMTLIQTDASINPGNSGGPMINMAGQVVGINFMKLTEDYESLGFAIPINYAVQIFNQLIQYGSVVQDPEDDFVATRARIGVQVYDVEVGLKVDRLTPTADYPKEGAFVYWVDPTTGAYAAGLRPYDIIVEFDGAKVENKDTLTAELAKHKAGEVVTMRIYTFSGDFSSGEYRTITFKLNAAE